ncbi:MAG: transposase [Solirubrobacteraceae bacterium]
MLFTRRCAKAGIEISIGSVGDCYDNAVCEAFHASLKKERIYRRSWATRADARAAIFEYIEGWYNPRRRHSTLGYLSPTEFERQHAQPAQRALQAPISANVSVASIAPRAADELRTRRALTAGVDYGADGSILPQNAVAAESGPAQAAPHARSKDGREDTWPLQPVVTKQAR